MPNRLDAPRRADVRERDLGELARRVGEDADPHTRRLQAAELRARLGARPEVDRSAVVGEALQERPPVAEPLVEDARCRGAILRQVELHMRPPRHVHEPVPPEGQRVREDGVEIESDGLQALDARLALQTGER